VCQSDYTLKNRIHSLWGGMSRPELWGLIVLGAGIVVGLVSGGPAGLVLAAVCLVVGLVLFVASEAMGTKHSGVNPNTASTEQKASVLVLVKEVHARPQRGNKFQEISDPHQADLEFEVFANCWMINVTDEPLGIRELQFSLRIAEGSATVLQRIRGDLANWRLGRLKDELDSWGVRYLQGATNKSQSWIQPQLWKPALPAKAGCTITFKTAHRLRLRTVPLSFQQGIPGADAHRF
jgi:hypothetical protein